MIKLLDRYIFREMSGYTLLGVGVASFLLMTPELLRLSELLARESLSLTQVVTLFLNLLPRKLIWVFPLATLLGLLMGVSHLAAHQEIVAMQAAGLGVRRLTRPVMMMAALGALLTGFTTLVWAPSAERALVRFQDAMGTRQLHLAVRPGVFEERFPGRVLYVQESEGGGAQWRGLLLADLSRPDSLRLTLARSAVAQLADSGDELILTLRDGTAHEYALGQPERYSLASFGQRQLSLPLPRAAITVNRRESARLGLAELYRRSRSDDKEGRFAAADLHRRFVLPVACLALGLLAFPLGMHAQSGGRSIGFVMAVGLGMGYYFLFLFGDRMAREGTVPVFLGMWFANLCIGALGLYLLHRLCQPISGADFAASVRHSFQGLLRKFGRGADVPQRSVFAGGFGWLKTLDVYLLRGTLFHFILVEIVLLGFFALFQMLEMLDDLVARPGSWHTVARLLWYLLPQAIYLMTPLALLLAVMVELSLMNRRNEIVAIKAAGVSLYRLIGPVVMLALVVSALLFWLDSTYLPEANQRQEALRSEIRGRPARTFFLMEQRWLFGEAPRIYHYAFFDPANDTLARLEVLELDAEDFSLRRRIFADRAHWAEDLGSWVLESGWARDFRSGEPGGFESFHVGYFPELTERPEYFRKEVKESAQMNWRELGAYIRELKQSGLDATPLEVEWHRKFAFPLIAAVMVLIAFPFGLLSGRQGALGGLALGVALGLAYWVTGGFFQALGNFGLLPPALSGWGPNVLFASAGLYLGLSVDT